MNAKTAERLISCHTPGETAAAGESRVQKAVRYAERDEQLRPKLQEQIAFDTAVRESLSAFPVPAELPEKIAALDVDRPSVAVAVFKNPPFVAAAISIAIVIVLLVRGALERSENYPGREAVLSILDSTTQEMSSVEMEPINPTELGRMNDWFAMKDMDGFHVPPEFAKFKAIGARVMRTSGQPVAITVIEQHDMLLYAFRGEPLGVRPPVNWRVLERDQWVFAIRKFDDLSFIVAFRGSEEEMDRFLSSELK